VARAGKGSKEGNGARIGEGRRVEEGEAGGGAATVAEQRPGGELCASGRRGTEQSTCSGKKKRGEGVRRTCLKNSEISGASL
jgi:hypothetical protein